MANIKINGRDYTVSDNSTILEACREAGIEIPTLCYMKDINAIGACRICLVEVKGARSMPAACVQPINEGMEIITNSPAVMRARKLNLELLLSDHEKNCLACVKNQKCELQKYAKAFGVDDTNHFAGKTNKYEIESTTAYLVRDNNKCINCRRCVAACSRQQGVAVIGPNDRGFDTHIGCAFEQDLSSVACIGCGQCTVACPVGALVEKDDTQRIFDALSDPKKHVVICTAPSVRATLGECFDMAPGTDVEGKMVAALKRLGFDGVYNMNFTADLTIIEEAHELIERIKNGGKLPLITSCSPGWIKFCEHYFPDFLDNLSSCKSPQQMFGALYKTYYAAKAGLDPKDIFFVSSIPCTAKKFEVTRDFESAAGVPDVDVAVTTRELGRMIEKAGIDFASLPDEQFDEPFLLGSGAGVIFGATGGVMEAALRTAAETILGTKLEKLEFEDVRGTEGIKKASYKLGDLTINVAAISGTANAKEFLNKIRKGEEDVQFVEVMACPGGCVNGGGQPIQPMSLRNFTDLKSIRAKVLYDADKNLPLRKSHENEAVKTVYKEFFGEPGSHKAHEILHTKYTARSKF